MLRSVHVQHHVSSAQGLELCLEGFVHTNLGRTKRFNRKIGMSGNGELRKIYALGRGVGNVEERKTQELDKDIGKNHTMQLPQ